MTKFEKFLINRHIREAFIENHQKDNYGEFPNFKYANIYYFSWGSSTEGHEFWSKINEEWTECVHDKMKI